MTKITQLPLAEEITKSEHVPIVQAGEMRRVILGDMFAPVDEAVAAAQAAAGQAADLVLPANIFVDVDLATAEGAVSIGTTFKLVSSVSGLAEVRKRTVGGSEFLYTESTTAYLASSAGAGGIGLQQGGTAQDALQIVTPQMFPGTDTQRLTSCIAAAAATGLKMIVAGTYYTTDTIIFAAFGLSVEFINGAKIVPDPEVLIGVQIGGAGFPSRMRITGLKVERAAYSGETENIGIQFLETNQSTFIDIESRFSKYNFDWYPSTGGSAYSTFINPQAVGGFKNFRMRATGTGWSNENVFVGGRGFCTADTDTNFSIEGGGEGTGHNRMLGVSLEGQGVRGIYDNDIANFWEQCRSEGTWTSGSFHVYGPDCLYPTIISSRYDYTLDRSAAPDPRDTVITYRNGWKLNTANNGLTSLDVLNQSAAGGSGVDITSNLDASTAFSLRGKRQSDGLVRWSMTTDGRLTVARQLKSEQSGHTFSPLMLGAYAFWVNGGRLWVKNGTPASASDGLTLDSLQATASAANISSAAATINTTDKFGGKLCWDSTNNRMMRASGSTATSPWHVIDGSASVIPV